MKVDVETQIDIGRSRSEVASFVEDPANAPRWYENITSVRVETPGPLSVGSRIAFEARFLSRRLSYIYEIRDMAHAERFVMSTARGPFEMETTYQWSDTPAGGTRMTLRNRGEPHGFSKLAAPMMARAMRRENRKDLERLKELLESRSLEETVEE